MPEQRKLAIVTGGSAGIGEATAARLARDGYNIAVLARSGGEAAAASLAACRSNGAEAEYFRCDVSQYTECEAALKAAVERFGPVYALINNAGITRDALLMRMSEEQFDQVVAVNLKGVYNMSKLALPYMIKAREGRIISISSIIGLRGNAGQTNYAATKAGIIGFTKSLAREVGSRGITVNAVAPGYIRTSMTEAIPEAAREKLVSSIALVRLGKPEDVAGCVSFLAGPDSAYITGQVISVDGGM